ncbi:MAG: PAS domain S-box protein [Sulfuricella sp.]|nr:PAS domain S-box protein [Sulfuricella sp.]
MPLFFRSFTQIPLIAVWLVALAAGYAAESALRVQVEALTHEALGGFQRELRQAGSAWEEGLAGGKPAASAASRLPAVAARLFQPGDGGPEYVLLNSRDIVLRASRQDWVGAPAEGYFGAQFLPLAAKARQEQEVTAELTGNELIGAYPLRGNVLGESHALLVARRDVAPQLSAPVRAHRKTMGYLLGVTLFLSALLVAHALVSVNRRLGRIGDAMARFAEGDPDSRAGLAGGDAIARLGSQFDAMTQRMAPERRNLAESEERLKFALHGSNAGIWDWRMDSGHTYYSPRWKSLLGFAENELLAHAEEWLKRVHPDDLSRVMELLNAHLGGQSDFFESEHRLRRKDGSYLWVLERGTAIRDQGGVYRMVGALTDISRRKEVESALQRSEEEYRSVVEGVTQVIFRSDAQGRLTFLNPAWSELTGYSVESSLSRPIRDFVLADDRRRAGKLFQAVGEGASEIVQGEFRLAGRDGTGRWLSLHARALRDGGGVAGIAGVLTDIDAQKNAQNALTRSNNERKAILDLSPDGYVFIDHELNVAYVNPAFLAMTGFGAADVQGQSLGALELRLGALCDEQKPLPAFAAAANDGETLYLARPEKAVLKWQARTIRDESGVAQGSVMYFRDVTRETEIDRMKSEFLSTAAHELRTPMASIFGFSELLLAREFDPATQRDLIQTIHRQTRNLIDLVNELLDLARIEARGGKSFKIQEQDVTPLVLNAAASLYLPAETHRMEVDLPKDLPLVRVDAEKFRQCLANVLSNALKYSPGGGVIRVSAARRSAKGRDLVGVAVQDQGIGMTPEQMAHIFDRFYRADVSGAIPGTGLGMALVKETMEILGGEVTVNSVPGQGTEVSLWLQAVRPARKAA